MKKGGSQSSERRKGEMCREETMDRTEAAEAMERVDWKEKYWKGEMDSTSLAWLLTTGFSEMLLDPLKHFSGHLN